MKVAHWTKRLLAVASLSLLASGCPALLDDEFEIVDPKADASVDGSGGLAGGGGSGGADADVDGASGTAGTAGGDAGACDDCSGSEECCDRSCVNVTLTPTHCGACGLGCPGTTCSSGSCTNQCQFGWLDCDQNVVTGCEVNARNDPDNCGNCNTACAFDQTCEQGKCTCPAGSADCNGDLTDGCEISIGSDPQNCGGCGQSCGPNQLCDGGACGCEPGFADCNADPNDGCEVNLATNAAHCGACNKSCGDNGACSASVCGCAPGFLDCDAQPGCEAAATSPQTCGSCLVQCAGSTPSCNGTSCVSSCSAGQQLCGGSCVNLQTDPLHCGGCSSPVGPNQVCVAGQPQCAPGWGDCTTGPGCETDVTTDKNNCGGCGTICKAGAICSSSQCQCAASTPNDCGSSCRECCDASQCSDSNPCTENTCTGAGTCSFGAACASGGNCCPALGCFECCNDAQCTGGKVCSNNVCVLPTCTSPEILCGTSCVNPNTDANNCGSCGNHCGIGRTCSGGSCTPKWVATPAPPAGFVARSRAASAFITTPPSAFVWGGQDASGALATGAIYDLTTNTWSSVTAGANAPSARVLATAVWTGQHVFVWGGGNGTQDYATGALYDPVAKTWSPVSTQGAPSARRAAYAVYTGSGVLVWGGVTASGQPANGAYLYDPVTDQWSATSTTNDPSARLHATVGWSGTSFYVYGGLANQSLDDFFRFQPANDAWNELAEGPERRFGAFGGWDGLRFIAWGGRREGGGPPTEWADGERFDPTSGAWGAIASSPLGARHVLHRESGWSARISGGNTLMLGGVNGPGAVQKSGAIYNSTTNEWSSVPAWPSAEDRRWAVAVWLGSELFLWGGLNGTTPSATGERFRP